MGSVRKARPAVNRSGRHPVLAGTSILIVEDEPLVALDTHAALSATGASIISAATASEAVRLTGYADVTAAIVDIQLGSEDAAKVCDALARRGIPFIFYTGRADKAALLTEWPDAPVIRKPAMPHDIVATLSALLASRIDPDVA